MTETLEILFLGDLVGRPARRFVKDFLGTSTSGEKKKYDFVIANVENASHGFGLSEKNYNELSAYLDCMTSGNHIWDKNDILNYIDNAEKLIRPINYPKSTLGNGYCIFDVKGSKIAVINVLGTIFMNHSYNYWEVIKEKINQIKQITPIIIIDIHAEATAEKICFAKWSSDLGVSAVIGTHTHVQTNDACILNNKTAYITDVGFCGVADSVIGMDYDTSLNKFLTFMPQRYEVAKNKEIQISALHFSISKETGNAEFIENFIIKKDYSEVDI